tara:strand:- start:169540 stop:169743 length:204 start_codon:yes stop_codon:yes gene_type:complete
MIEQQISSKKQLITVANGAGANLKRGQHPVLPKDTRVCNVWLTMLRGLGINTLRHVDSGDAVKEFRA